MEMTNSNARQWNGQENGTKDAAARILTTATSTARTSSLRSSMPSSLMHSTDDTSSLSSQPVSSSTTTPHISSPTSISPSSTPPASSASSLPYDLNISNGTCYYAPNQAMDPGFIPCGNAASDTKACCWTGDVCLGDQACFGIHQGVYTTYMGGCTDDTDTLANDKCPQKPDPYSSEPWIGLAYCNGTSDEWIACPQEASPSIIKGAGPCVCPAVTQQRIVAFRDASVLPSYASLPTVAGGSIKWLGGYTPTVGTTDAGGAQTSLSSVNGGTSSSRVSLIVGLSVGISGIILLALVSIFAFYRRKELKQKEGRGIAGSNGGQNANGGAGDGSMNNAVACSRSKGADAPQATSTVISELEIRPARPWSLRSELDGGYPVGIAGTNENGAGDEADREGPGQSVSRMSSGRISYGPISPMTTGPSLAEALEMSSQMTSQMTGSSATSAQTPSHTGQATDTRRHPSMHSMHSMRSTQSTNDRRPPFETLVELE